MKRILTGIRPTSKSIHLGNYEGAIVPLLNLQKEHHVFCMIADYHALTTGYTNPEELKQNTLEIAKDIVACGLDLHQSKIFVQSHIPEHAELHLLLSMTTPLGWLERMPTFKEKASEQENSGEERASYGLLGYPVLQTADILLYRPDGVPVGKDQAPHLEIGNDIAERFNRLYGKVFTPYKCIVPEDDSRSKVPGTDMRKMSKSYDNTINITDSPDEVKRKIMGAYTTPTKIAKTDPGIPEGCAVCQLTKLYGSNSQEKLDGCQSGERGCVQNKKDLIEEINAFLAPIQERRANISDLFMKHYLEYGKSEARRQAKETIKLVKTAMGLF